MSPPTEPSSQAFVCLLVRPIRSIVIDTVKIAPPSRSKFDDAFVRLTVGSRRPTKYSETRPIGMLT